MFDMIAHLTRQAAFSRATFGPGPRTKGVLDHIAKEIEEVREFDLTWPNEPNHEAMSKEWVDIAILGLDGLTRSIWAAEPHWTADWVAEEAVKMILAKQGKNERRDWPDWRTAPADAAIEHVRGHED